MVDPTVPMRTRPRLQRRRAVTGSPLTNVPFLLPRSSISALSPGRDARVVPRDAVHVDPGDGVTVPPEDVLALAEGDLPVAPDELEDDTGGARRSEIRGGQRVSREGVTEPVHGPNESRFVRLVSDRLAELGHQAREVPFGDEDAGPERLDQLLLGDRFWAGFSRSSSNRNVFSGM